jgi:hypothetical protein
MDSVHGVLDRGKNRPSNRQEGVGGSAKSGVVMKAEPGPTFEVVEPELPLEFLIVALDAPP